MMENNYRLLIQKLDEFIRKFYVNKLIRGAIYTGTFLLAAFIVIDVLEYFFYFPSSVRTVLFWGFTGGAAFTFADWIAIPMLHYYKLGKIISHEKAANIIGSHFKNVKDRLLNILQLKKQMNDADESSLIEASINQKISELKPVPFSSAINLSVNKKYLRYLVAPVLVLSFILLASPNLIRDSTFRIIHHGESFERKAPFQFTIANNKLQTVQYEDFELQIKVSGEFLPNEAFIHLNGYDYPLTKKNATEYSYVFTKPQKDVAFNFNANGFSSKEYQLKVLAKPIIIKFSTDLNYPSYLGKKNETQQNIGDLTVPEGTKINWHFYSQNTSNIVITFSDSILNTEKTGSDEFAFTQRLKHDAPYTIYVSGNELPRADSIRYSITVVPDRYPAIQVSQVNDSINKKYLYFVGEASDDYGLKNLFLKYRIEHEGDDNPEEKYESVPVSMQSGKYSQFSQFWDVNSVQLNPGDRLVYFFEVWDNDGVNGSKFTRSTYMIYQMPSTKQMEEKTEEKNDAIKKNLESSMKEAEQLKNEYEKLQNDLLNKKNPSWEDKKKIEDLLQKQQELNNKIEQTQKDFKENIENQKGYKQYDEQLKQKQEDLQKLMNDVLTPEMKEMMKKLQDMLEQLNKDKTIDQLQDQKLSNEELQKQLDRMLALFKQLEFEQKFKDTQNKLDQLAGKQDSLANKTSEQKENKDSLSSKQSDIQNDFKDVEKDLEKLDSMNQQLDHPGDMPDMQEQQQQTEEQMNNAQQNLQKNNSSKASQNQKSAAQKMEEMSKQMQSTMQSMQQQQDEMDMQKTRQILENLLKISFDQEELINKTKGVNIYNPQYLQIMKDQHDVGDDLQMVEDSIQELSKTQFSIKSFVDKQITDINKNQEQTQQSLEARQPAIASSSQQMIMTDVNNLALMFEEVMQQMQQQMSGKMQGTQMCQHPGGAKPNMNGMSQMQKQLNDKIQQLGEKMKGGQMKPGAPGSEGISQELAQMAAQQAALRNALRELNDALNKDGKQSLGDLDQLQKEMDKTETDLLNKQITAETLKRQQEILTKLLEAENAERQRDQDNKRQSETGHDMVKPMPPEIAEYLKKKQAEMELYKTVPPDLKPFYRSLVEDYFRTLKQ